MGQAPRYCHRRRELYAGRIPVTLCAKHRGYTDPENTKKGWFNYNPPTSQEMQWIKNFGKYVNFNPNKGKLKDRLTLEIANLKEATRISWGSARSMGIEVKE